MSLEYLEADEFEKNRTNSLIARPSQIKILKKSTSRRITVSLQWKSLMTTKTPSIPKTWSMVSILKLWDSVPTGNYTGLHLQAFVRTLYFPSFGNHQSPLKFERLSDRSGTLLP